MATVRPRSAPSRRCSRQTPTSPTARPSSIYEKKVSTHARDGVVEQNLVWKDTVLVRTGETVDILLDVNNPGVWMAHCHIAEHHESGMMFSFHVDPQPAEDRG